jgi:Amidohydrolase
VYNDYVIERYLPYKDRMRPTAAIPLTDIDDAVAEIERIARAGLGAILLPEIPPLPYWSPEYDRLWAAAQANGTPVFIHTATGGVKVGEGQSQTASRVKGMMEAVNMGKNPLDQTMVSNRSMGGGNAAESPQRIIADLVSSGVCERFPDLHFNLIEFGAGWLVSYLGSMDKAWKTGTGQDPDGGSASGTTLVPPTTSRTWGDCSTSTRGGPCRSSPASTSGARSTSSSQTIPSPSPWRSELTELTTQRHGHVDVRTQPGHRHASAAMVVGRKY